MIYAMNVVEMKKGLILLFASVLILMTVSCKDDEGLVDVAGNLTSTKNWKLSEVTLDGLTVTDSIFGDSCQNYLLFKLRIDFNSDKTFFVDNSDVICDGDTLQDEDGIWSVSENQKEFVLLSTFQTTSEFDMNESTESKFVLVHTESSGEVWKITYVKR